MSLKCCLQNVGYIPGSDINVVLKYTFNADIKQIMLYWKSSLLDVYSYEILATDILLFIK